MKFPYARIGGYSMPVIPVKLCRGDLCIVTEALIDSGAAGSILDAELAGLLGIHALDEDGIEMVFEGVSGHTLVGYSHEVTIDVGGHRFAQVPIAFSREMPDNAVNILGQEGFFNLFAITFTYKKREIELRLG